MQNLLSILIVVSLIPIQTLASEIDDCKEAVKSAEIVIQKQDELLQVMKSRNDDLFKEKTSLERSLEDAQEAQVRTLDHEILWGVIGVAVGVLVTAYVTNRTK